MPFRCESLQFDQFECSKCIICCEETVETLALVQDRGLNTLLEACEICQCMGLADHLHAEPAQILIHSSCRKRFTDPRQLNKRTVCDVESVFITNKKLRSASVPFEWKKMCLFCAEIIGGYDISGDTDVCEMREDLGRGNRVREAMTIDLKTNICKQCDARRDDWSHDVRGRLESVIDLPAAEAIYHSGCFARFMTNREHVAEKVKHPGRHVDAEKLDAFDELCEWLERSCDDKCYTLDELHDRMSREMSSDVYSKYHLKRKLAERYGNHLIFAEVRGRKNVLCFKDLCSFILSDKWYTDRKANLCDESERIVLSASKLIAEQIRNVTCDMSTYPTSDDIQAVDSVLVPPLLQLFMQVLVSSNVKRAALSQCIVQAARPCSIITPIPFGVAVQMDHVYGSKFLINELSRLGMCLSYDEVVRFKHSVITSQTPGKASGVPYPTGFTQWVADNVDHNVRTLDGYGTFHGMGIISATTSSAGPIESRTTQITRLSQRLLAAEVVKNRGIKIVQYYGAEKSWLMTISMQPIDQLDQPVHSFPLSALNLVWHGGWFCSDSVQPSWSGFMQTVCSGLHSSAAVVQFLPLIDLNPSDESCIYSTLLYVTEQAKQLNIVTPCITFDMPLWLKAVDISKTAGLNIVCKLGGFHTIMSFLGAIGNLMCGSGLEDMFHLNYGPETVTHIMSGKAVARSIRAHFLVSGALMIHLLNSAMSIDELHMSLLSSLQSVYTKVRNDGICLTGDCSILSDPLLLQTDNELQQVMNKLSSQSRTAKLWLQYMKYIDLLKLFIAAERTGNWRLHLHCLSKMLNLFAATGRNNYAKGGRLYLQLMTTLPDSHPWLYKQFADEGFHVIRRSDRFWAGLSSDLVIEQTLMRTLKGRGGLTRGRGMNENVRSLWVSTMHECASVHQSVSSMTGSLATTQEHTDMGELRLQRDKKDLQKVLDHLLANDPFSHDECRLFSLSSGSVANDSDNINCDDAESVGRAIMLSIDDRNFGDVVMKKSNQIRNLACLQKQCCVDNKPLNIDSSLLFHRLIVLVERTPDISIYFQYELAPIPTALFKDRLMRKADKATLAKQLTNALPCSEMPKNVNFVIDGGYLLRKVRWHKNTTYGEVFRQYNSFVNSRCCKDTVIVFDGYANGPSTKDHEHKRRLRNVKAVAPDILFNENTPVIFDQQTFLANKRNKQRLIEMLMSHLSEHGFLPFQADGDADVDIVSQAIKLASKQQLPVAVIAEDTDILVMLSYHLSCNMAEVWLVSDRKMKGCTEQKRVRIRALQHKLGLETCQQLLVIHALGGCDTTSAMFGHGKGSVCNKISNNPSSKSLTDIMQNSEATQDEVLKAGLQLMVMVYGGKPGDSLNKMRYTAYCRMVSTSFVKPQPEKLPPTERSALFHLLRIHLQAVIWKSMNAESLNPLQWGWENQLGEFVPVMTDQEAAPDDLLNMVRCKCKTACASVLCSCRKHGLKCVSACTHCNGVDCSNIDALANSHELDHVDSDTDSADEVLHFTKDDSHQDLPVIYDSDIDWTREEVVEDGR